MKRKKVGSFGIIRPPPKQLTKEDRDTEGVPSTGSSKFLIKIYCYREKVIV
eukprot:UN01446